LEKIGEEKNLIPLLKYKMKMRFTVWIGIFYSQCVALHSFKPYHVKHIIHHNKFISRIRVGLRFTINSKNTHDNFFFHYTFLLICYNIHLLLIINGHLSLAFKFLLRTCQPTTKTLKSLNNNQSNKKKNLNLPNNGNCHHC